MQGYYLFFYPFSRTPGKGGGCVQRFGILLVPVLLLFPLPVFGETAWEVLQGPTIRVEATIHPYVNVTVNLADEKGQALPGREPVVVFDCDRGPGTYRANNPLVLSVVTNTPLQVFAEARPLQGKEKATVIPPERLAIAITEQGKEAGNFVRFLNGKKLLLFETSAGGIAYTARCDLQLEITHEDRAGEYAGTIVVEVFYRP